MQSRGAGLLAGGVRQEDVALFLVDALCPERTLPRGELFAELDVLSLIVVVIVVGTEHDVAVARQDVVGLGFIGTFSDEVTETQITDYTSEGAVRK